MPKTVLLADDSITIQRVVELAFAQEDVSVLSVDDGDRAVESIRHSAPDLVLADIGMPGRTGYEVAEFIRSQPNLTSVPVLLLAGAFEAVDHAQARHVGADGILTKPFDPALLIARVNELLANGRPVPQESGRVATAPPAAVPPPTVASRVAAAEPIPPPAIAATAAAGQSAAETKRPAADSTDTAAAAAAPAERPVSETDRYFEQLDQKFAALAQSPWRPRPTAADAAAAEEAHPAPHQGTPPVPAEDLTLTDAFAALLDAERSGEPGLPARLATFAPSAPLIDVDALAEQIARKVLEQLSDRVVRETVAEIVDTTAERLVREEIDRIKRNIK